jgi:Transposase DDE domain group 1
MPGRRCGSWPTGSGCPPRLAGAARRAAGIRTGPCWGDLAVLLADGGDCLSDLAVLRDQPALFGPVASTPAAGLPGPRAGATTDLAELVNLAMAQRPADERPVLVRSDSAGGSTRLAWHLRERGSGFSLGMQSDAHVREAIPAQPEHAWTPAVEPDGRARDGAEACELTGWIDLHTWPAGTRAICRREDAHPGAQLRFTDHDGHRFQVFLTDQADPDLARLELRHRQRARVEDRIRAAKATGLANLPFHRWRRNPSGSSWSWPPKTSPAGPRRCSLPARWPAPNPRRCATGSSTSPPASSATPAASCCGGKPPGRGPSNSPARSLGCGPCRCAADPPSNADGLPNPTGSGHAARQPPEVVPATRTAAPAADLTRPRTPLTPPDSRPRRPPPHPHESRG